jgi:PleD family two-component response regulator
MLTIAASSFNGFRGPASSTGAQKVVIVNGSTEMLELLETVLEERHYDVVFVESHEHAYSQIKRIQPHLVILCVRIEDLEGFLVLSMLKLDEATRQIPVLTYTSEYEEGEPDAAGRDLSDVEIFTLKPAVQRMN